MPTDRTTTLHGESTDVSSGGDELRTGACVGRYVLLGELGTGGMGTVFEALDPELDRRVALKVLHSRFAGPGNAARLLREGQALARVSHPNVVQVFEVGRHADTVFVVMELVRGQSVAGWLAQPRPWREVVRVFTEAARGLAAAHAEDIVHRDFKPGNVQLAEDGTVKVLDFGLARGLGVGSSVGDGTELALSSGSGSGLLNTKLTRDGAVIGTPSYMAAEQFRGELVDHRADQHAFCVSLFEGLYGRRPFHAAEWKALRRAVLAANLGKRPNADVPRSLWRLIHRGTRPTPEARFGSMHEIIERLERIAGVGPSRSMLRLVVPGIVALGGLGAIAASRADPSTQCADTDAALAGVWDEARRSQALAAIDAVGVAYGEQVRTRVGAHLDDYTTRWATQRTDVCAAIATATGEGAKLQQRRMECLDDSIRHLGALVEVLATTDETTLAKAVPAARSLPPLSRCADTERLTALVAPPPETAEERIEALERSLALARTRLSAGHGTAAREAVPAIVGEAEAIGYEPLLADAYHLESDVLVDEGDYAAAEPRLEAAYHAAASSGADERVAALGIRLCQLVGDRLRRPEDGEVWARHASGAIARLADRGHDVTGLEGMLAQVRGATLVTAGKYAEGVALLEGARNQLVLAKGDYDLDIAAVDVTLGSVLSGLARYDEAEAALDRALDLYGSAFGQRHPRLAGLHGAMSNLHKAQGRAEDAARHAQVGAQIVVDAHGEGHPLAAKLYLELGSAEEIRGEYDAAARAYDKAIESIETSSTPDEGILAVGLAARAGIARMRGELEAARLGFEKAARGLESAGRPSHLATTLTNLGGVYGSLGRTEDAVATLERAEGLLVEIRGADNPAVAEVLAQRGRVLIDAGKAEDGIQPLERSLAIATGKLADTNELVIHIRRELAEAQRVAGHTDEALVLAQRAVSDADASKELTVIPRAATRLTLARVLADRDDPQSQDVARTALDELDGIADPVAETVRGELRLLAS